MNRMFCSLTYVFVFAASVVFADESSANDGVVFATMPGRVHVAIDGVHVATWIHDDPKIPRPYLTDVRGLDGTQVTRNHPPVEAQDRTDHATMHPGIWLAFGDIGGIDVWRNQGRVEHEKFLQGPAGGSSTGSFTAAHRYETKEGKPVVNEVCKLTFQKCRGGYLIHWDSTFSGEQSFAFGDQEEMGLGIRVATPIAVDSKAGGRILDNRGRNTASAIWGQTADWCDYAGPIGDKFAGMTVMSHPHNARPCRWHVRNYGFLAANPFGQLVFDAGPKNRFVVQPDTELRLRFAVFVHVSTKPDDDLIHEVYKAYQLVGR